MRQLSIVIETENAQRTTFERSAALLRALRDERAALGISAEIRIMHDPARMSASEVDVLLAAAGLTADPELPVQVHVAKGKRYYEMKNLGATLADGEIILLVDSDIVPEPGFLAAMLKPFADPDIAVVGGSPYVSPRDTLLARASAVYWMFAPRSADGPLQRTHNMMANSVAMRREVMLAHPFPETDGFRAQTGQLARELARSKIGIWRSPRARATHPPPSSLATAAVRALWEGHDRFVDRPKHLQRPARPTTAARGLAKSANGQLRRFANEWRGSGLTPVELPAAFALALSFEALARVGFLASWVDRGLLARFFQS